MSLTVNNWTQPIMTKEKIISVKSNLLWHSIPWREGGVDCKLNSSFFFLSKILFTWFLIHFTKCPKHFCQSSTATGAYRRTKLYLTLGQIQDFREREVWDPWRVRGVRTEILWNGFPTFWEKVSMSQCPIFS